MNARISSSRRVMIASVGVCTRPSETAPSKDERSRIVAARVAFMPTIQSASERDRAASSSSRSSSPGRRWANASRIACVGHRAQPQALDGLLGAGLLEQVGEDQLALAAGVAGVDDVVDVVAAQQRLDDAHLLLRALVAHDELELRRHDRQIGHAPLLELVVVLVGLGELNEVADGPVMTCSGPSSQRSVLSPWVFFSNGPGKHAREILPDGWLLGDDEGLAHVRREGSAVRWASGRRCWPTASVRPCTARSRRGCRLVEGLPDDRVGDAVAAARPHRGRGGEDGRRPPDRRASTIGPPELPGRTGRATR